MNSQIEGDFNGWDGNTVVKLVNGQVWEQAEYKYQYRYAYRPRVEVKGSGSAAKMLVEGMSGMVRVRRLR